MSHTYSDLVQGGRMVSDISDVLFRLAKLNTDEAADVDGIHPWFPINKGHN